MHEIYSYKLFACWLGGDPPTSALRPEGRRLGLCCLHRHGDDDDECACGGA